MVAGFFLVFFSFRGEETDGEAVSGGEGLERFLFGSSVCTSDLLFFFFFFSVVVG